VLLLRTSSFFSSAAPRPISALTTAVLGLSTAAINAVRPPRTVSLSGQPLSMTVLIVATSPLSTAKNSAFDPACKAAQTHAQPRQPSGALVEGACMQQVQRARTESFVCGLAPRVWSAAYTSA
jgi:hypothetical protein